MSLNEVHISSLVVHAVPEHLSLIKRQIESFDGAEIYGESPAGKLVVVIETQNQGFITDTIDAINQLDHVLSVALVFHQIESDVDDETNAGASDNAATICSTDGLAGAEKITIKDIEL